MGGIWLGLKLKKAPTDVAPRRALLKEIWEHCYARMQALTKKKAGRDVVHYYTQFQSSDHLDDARPQNEGWLALEDELIYSFSDAAGLCDGEMHASLHWLELLLLDEWPALTAMATARGAELAPRERTLADALTKSDPIFFISGAKLGYSHPKPEPPPDHELWFFPGDGGSKRVLLGKSKEPERLAALIKAGLCACEICQALRAKHGLPLAPEVAKKPRAAKKPPTPLAPPPAIAAPPVELAHAKVWSGHTPKALPKDGVVALDCAEKVPAATIRMLPSLPLRALSFRSRGMNSVLPQIAQLPHLEVLSLHGCSLRQPIGAALDGLQHLRALDLSGTMTDKAYDGSFWELPRLEVIDIANWRMIPRVAKMQRVRHFAVEGSVDPKTIAHQPIDSLIMNQPIDPAILAGWPLGFVHVTKGLTLPALKSVRFVELGYEENSVPEWVRALPNLHALSARYTESLPEWLIEMPNLEVLILAHSPALAAAPEKFRVIEKLTRLRVLVLAPDGGERVPFDLSALTELEYASVTWSQAKTKDDFVRGFDHVKRFYYSTRFALDDHPNAKQDGNVFRSWGGLTTYRWMLGAHDPAHWLGRFSTSTAWPEPPIPLIPLART